MRILDFITINKRWLFAGGLISFSSAYGQTFFISIFAGEIMAEFHLTNGEWGGIYTLGTTASALLMLYGGTLSDRFRARTLSAIVLGLLALACLFMAVNPVVWALPIAIFALRFTGQGMLSHVAVVSIARWFSAVRRWQSRHLVFQLASPRCRFFSLACWHLGTGDLCGRLPHSVLWSQSRF
jgi:sugar phosphate permease